MPVLVPVQTLVSISLTMWYLANTRTGANTDGVPRLYSPVLVLVSVLFIINLWYQTSSSTSYSNINTNFLVPG